MILDLEHYHRKIDDLNQYLWNKEFEVYSINSLKFYDYTKLEVEKHYNSIFYNFPLGIELASDSIGISVLSSQLFDLHHDLVELDKKFTINDRQKFLDAQKDFLAEDFLETVEDYIHEFFHRFINNYEIVLKNTKSKSYFTGVDNEVIILLNILKRYKSVLSDSKKQISIFWSLKLNKKVSDTIIEMLVEFIEHRLEMLTILDDNLPKFNTLNYLDYKPYKIEWKGSQQEFCELILMLERKNWIPKIKEGERRKISKSFTELFDLSSTGKSKKSNTFESFYQIMKGECINGVRTFPFLEKENYLSKFDKISKNK